jgi:two-component system CheB/CheR fusion protein
MNNIEFPDSELDKSADGKARKNDFLIVGIGASAGGVQALREFFVHVPDKSGMAYVVILHLSPSHDSKLAEVLQATTAMQVLQVTEKTHVIPDRVYVIPPNQHLIMVDGYLDVSPNMEVEDRRAPVDIFFRTLAESHGSRAVSVILSGTGANGSMGLKRVKEMGGAAFVQNPREAEFNEMPRNAIATDMVDEVLPVVEIPDKIIAYRNSMGLVHIPVEAEKRPEDQQHALREVFSQLRIRTGHDFSNYKRPTLLRRIERRITVRNLPNLPAYAAFLQQNPDETTALLKDLLISVTNFFRDKKAFETIEREVIPNILKNKTTEAQLRIWVAGCATGEEAYSIAMMCAEQTTGIIDAPKVQIFATDIDEAAIAIAREGLYTINDAADVSTERLRRFFNKEGDSYRIRREIREMILFANHNFIKDPPFSHIDLISCRNVLIYLNHTAQERVMETFHFALNPGAYLFLGSSESADSANDLYAIHSREDHIFRSRQVTPQSYPVPESVPALRFEQPRQVPTNQENQEKRAHERITYGDLHQRLLEQYAPPSVILNEEYDIVHLTERAGRYLQIGGGEPTQNLLKLVRQELRLELRSALYQAVQRKTAVEARGLKLTIDDRTETLNIQVRPVLNETDIARGFILVVFERTEDKDASNEVVIANDEPVARQLEEELMRLKTQLRASNEQHEFHAEELKASNEELQAMNEELRSAAEELETSKEELQSINEELRTVNQELKVKIEETTMASNNLQNLINSVDFATVFLDRSFRVNLFSPAARDIFNLIPADYGRALSDITSKLNYDGIIADAEAVLEKLQPVEREVGTHEGRVFMMRVLPYRTAEDRISGVVITFFDITRRKHAEEALRKSEEHLRLLIESAKDFVIFTFDMDRHVNSWNSGAELVFGYTEAEIMGQSADIFFTPEDREISAPEKEAERAINEGKAKNERWHLRKDGSRFYGSGMVRPLYDADGQYLGFVKIMRDLTERQLAQEAMRKSEERLRITVESASEFAIITLDEERRIVGWNSGARNILGYTELEIIGQTADIIFTPEDREAGIPLKEQTQALHEGKAMDERWHLRKDGSRIFMSGVLTLIPSDVMPGFVKIARDITDRKIAEQRKDEFISIASHELKTPVTSIKAYTEVLLELFTEAQENERTDLMQKLNKQVDRLTNLIHELLDTAKISENRLPLNKEQFNLNELIAERVDECRHLSSRHNLLLQEGDIQDINADKERISQVIINLVSNAIKYSPDDTNITITTAPVDKGVLIQVRDEGIGIPAEFQGKVFERFFRVENPLVQTYPGMGLGLYITAGIIQNHGGTISLESDEDKGAVFSLTLPYQIENSADENNNADRG